MGAFFHDFQFRIPRKGSATRKGRDSAFRRLGERKRVEPGRAADSPEGDLRETLPRCLDNMA